MGSVLVKSKNSHFVGMNLDDAATMSRDQIVSNSRGSASPRLREGTEEWLVAFEQLRQVEATISEVEKLKGG